MISIRIHRALIVLFLLTVVTANAAITNSGRPTSTNNDDTCDIALLPAATLLVPYFEVDIARGSIDTLLTITNVSNQEQVAHVILWSDWAYPVVDFNIYLTGYDVQSISLYDVIARGLIAPPRGTGFEDPGSAEGDFSGDNPLVEEETCRSLPMSIGQIYTTRMQQAFTTGRVPAIGAAPECTQVGSKHVNAIGYVTIDATNRCGTLLPTDPGFTTELLFDNVLVGDYQHVDSGRRVANGSPMVHIRAIPEGGTAAERAAAPDTYRSNFPRTFYGRFQRAGADPGDGRQPLPTQFAARWVSDASRNAQTEYRIWREGKDMVSGACGSHPLNAQIPVAEVVRFDEDENPTAFAEPQCCGVPYDTTLPAVAQVDSNDSDVFPPVANGTTGGWLFLNLDDPRTSHASQAWIVASKFSRSPHHGASSSMDVIALGNGCTPPLNGQSLANDENGFRIGPAPDANP